ncbi:MAG: DciA family protein [bacterium]|jgi:hypothetical protein
MQGQPYNPVHLDRLRATRGIVYKDVTIKEEMGMLLTHIKQQARALGDAGEAWGKVVPAEIGSQCELRHIKRGVLTVCAPNASVKFKLDAWLRAGGEQTVGQAARSVTKVRVV